MRRIGFRTGAARPAWAAPVSSGRFAFLEMEDRRAMRRSRSVAIVPAVPDPHREPSEQLLEAWAPVEAELRQAIDEATFNIWIAPIHPHALVGGKWRLGCARLRISWVHDRFGRVIESCAGRPVEFVVCEAVA